MRNQEKDEYIRRRIYKRICTRFPELGGKLFIICPACKVPVNDHFKDNPEQCLYYRDAKIEWRKSNGKPALTSSERKIKRKKKVLRRDDWTCQYCNIELTKENATVDHVIPKSKGGRFILKNLIAACRECNEKKADKLL